MRSILGFFLAGCVLAVCVAAYFVSVRSGASFMDKQWIFLLSLPYSWVCLHFWGETFFSPDLPAQLAYALLFNVASVYIVGAVLEGVLRMLWSALGGGR